MVTISFDRKTPKVYAASHMLAKLPLTEHQEIEWLKKQVLQAFIHSC